MHDLLSRFAELPTATQTEILLRMIKTLREGNDLDEQTDARLANAYFAIKDGAASDLQEARAAKWKVKCRAGGFDRRGGMP